MAGCTSLLNGIRINRMVSKIPLTVSLKNSVRHFCSSHIHLSTSMQCTDRVMMIQPRAFGYNSETAQDNVFQCKPTVDPLLIQESALAEFKRLKHLLTSHGVEVNTEEDTEHPETPDAVFPNNWVSFHSSSSTYPQNTIIIYPMRSANRRQERREDIIKKWAEQFSAKVIDLTRFEDSGQFLEGTGSMVLDRENKIAYACISPRTSPELVEHFCGITGYLPVTFHSFQCTLHREELVPVYHTNVMMTIGEQAAMICLDSIRDNAEREKVIKSLQDSGKTIIAVKEEQMNNFACNALELCDRNGEKLMVMSTRAYDALEDWQREKLTELNIKLIHCPIKTIEDLGGGGVRCMLAEIFPLKYSSDRIL